MSKSLVCLARQPSLLMENMKQMSLSYLSQLGIVVIVNWLQNVLFFVLESTSILLLLVRQCVQHVCGSVFRLKPYPEFSIILDTAFLYSRQHPDSVSKSLVCLARQPSLLMGNVKQMSVSHLSVGHCCYIL